MNIETMHMDQPDQNLMLILFLRVGFMAALSSLVLAVRPLREVVTGERRETTWRLARILLEMLVLASGIWARISLKSPAADMSLEGSFLLGWVHGPWGGVTVGLFLGLVEAWGGHWVPLAFLPLVGLAAGRLSVLYPEASNYSKGTRVGGRQVARQIAICIGVMLSLSAFWQVLAMLSSAPATYDIQGVFSFLGIIISSGISIVTALYIWRGFRMEAELENRTRQMEKVRMESLMERFRPHFLFNTLSAIVSLMRTDVEGARNMTIKLAGLLRRSLRESEGFVSFEEEMRFVRDYLDIESIRHGERLKIREVIPEDVRDVAVPRMVLQPIVENAILHGIDPKVEGGTVTIKARRSAGFLRITVADDGVGFDEPVREGIGMGNLRARLETAYGTGEARLEIESNSDGGTNVVIWIPLERKSQ